MNRSEHIITEPAALDEFCAHLDDCPTIGLDTEFIGEQTYVPDLCLIQVATPKRLVLIDPLTTGPLDEFWKRIADPKRTIVVHAGREEIRLCHFACASLPGDLFDVQVAAGLLGLGYPLSYGGLIQEVLNLRVAKGETLTNWRHRPLSDNQIRYAFDDVRYLLPIWKKLSDRLASLKRLTWLGEEMTALKHRAVVENPAVEKWRKLRGIGSLDRKKLAVVREVFAWREEKAAKVNRPARTVLRDDLVVEIARRNPKEVADLTTLRGLGKADFAGILAAVEEARNLPADEWPDAFERENDPPQVGIVANILNATLADFCMRERITSGLVATSQDVKWLVRAQLHGDPPPAESHLTHGWRKDHVLPTLSGILEGRCAIRIGSLRDESPLEYHDAK